MCCIYFGFHNYKSSQLGPIASLHLLLLKRAPFVVSKHQIYFAKNFISSFSGNTWRAFHTYFRGSFVPKLASWSACLSLPSLTTKNPVLCNQFLGLNSLVQQGTAAHLMNPFPIRQQYKSFRQHCFQSRTSSSSASRWCQCFRLARNRFQGEAIQNRYLQFCGRILLIKN